MIYPATMESLSLKFQVSRSNGLAVVTMWSYEFSGHSSAIFVIHRKFAPYMFLNFIWCVKHVCTETNLSAHMRRVTLYSNK